MQAGQEEPVCSPSYSETEDDKPETGLSYKLAQSLDTFSMGRGQERSRSPLGPFPFSLCPFPAKRLLSLSAGKHRLMLTAI